ncbi:MAG TPA: YfhE family protein [Niallia sp.]|nr:YfhE family protein [Niallia sp.]
MAAKLKAKEKSTLSSMQAVTYQREFKMADKAAQRKETKR